ncbi:MAG: bifunctional DNA primase/polymerase [Pirellulales bacterium]|nr:bifunctional DNA primase/polymerase [Pirellulales bacterium]
MDEALQAALHYAELGFAVFPCAAANNPAPLTKHGFKDATCDAQQIESWWRRYPGACIGVSTQGLLVVDVDDPPNPWLADHPDWAMDLIGAPTSITPGGGRHHIFRRPAGKVWACTVGRLAPRVDTRTDGGYIVAPPSVRPDGAYRWIEGCELNVGPDRLPEPPAWLAERLDDVAAPSPLASQFASSTSGGNAIPAGQRNATLARLAGTMRRVGMSRTEIRAALRQANLDRCSPPLATSEVDRIAASVARYEPDQVSVAVVENHFEQDRMANCEPLFPFITSRDLDAAEFELEYLVNGILVRGQPAMIAGPKKTLKTNISIDLALSLAEARPFLDRFDVKLSRRVGVMSGESGAATIQETARRVAASKQLALNDCDAAIWCFDVPQLAKHDHIDALRSVVETHALDVLILDPTYLMMLGLGSDAGNLFIVGALLKAIGELAQETGCTPVLCHHLKKSVAEPYEPAELENIAWAGFQEFVRQWILLNRRVRYDPDRGGHHELWMSVGGSAGHSGLWGVDVDEGVRDDPGGRRWDVRVLEASEAYEQRDAQEDLAGERRKESRAERKHQKERSALLAALAGFPAGETSRVIREAAGVSGNRFKDLMEELIDDGLARACEITKANGQKYEGFITSGTALSR